MTTMTLGPIATTVEIGIVESISSSTKGLHGGPLGITMATEVGASLTTMATMVTTTHGVAIGTTLGTTVALVTTGATDVLGVASMLAGVVTMADIMVVTMAATMVGMPIATGMAIAMVDTMVVGIDTTALLALATAEVQAVTMIEPPTMLSTDVP